MGRRKTIGIALLFGMVAGASAGPRWTPLGSEGGPVAALNYDLTTRRLFAATLGTGVYRSGNGARTWISSSGGITDTRILSLTSARGTLLVGTDDGGVFASNDGGLNWRGASNGLPAVQRSDGVMIFDPVHQVALRTGNAPLAFAATAQSLYRTTNSGQSWEQASVGIHLALDRQSRLSFDPTSSKSVVLGRHTVALGSGDHHWVYVSSDAGASWAPSETGLSPDNRGVRALFRSGSDSSTMFLGLEGEPGQANLYRSSDGGASWQASADGLPEDASVSSLLEFPGGLLLGTGSDDCAGAQGLWLSEDGGTNWTKASADLDGLVINSLVTDGKELFASTGGPGRASRCGRGILRSRDGGATWEPANHGARSSSILAVARDVTDPSTVLTSTSDGGVFLSHDAGQTFVPARGDLPRGTGGGPATALAIVPDDPVMLLALLSGEPVAGFYVSTDDGRSWEQRNGHIGGGILLPSAEQFTDLLVLGSGHYLASGQGGIYETKDDGGLWLALDTGIPSNVAGEKNVLALSAQPDTITRLAASTATTGVYSGEGGTWRAGSQGLPQVSQSDLDRIPALRWDAVAANLIYAGTANNGIYRRPGESVAWSAVNTGLPSLDAVFEPVRALAQFSNGRLIAGFGARDSSGFLGGIYGSDDRGNHWSPSNQGVPRAPVTGLAVSGTGVVVGTDGAGLVRSTDGGASFQPGGTFSTLPSKISAVAVDSNDPQRVWVGTASDGVFRSNDGGRTFKAVNTGLDDPAVRSLVFTNHGEAPSPERLYAGTQSAMFQSLDGGDSWGVVPPGLPDGPVGALLVAGVGARAAAGTLWASVSGDQLYVLEPGSAGFVTAGLNEEVRSLLIEEATGLLFAGTDGNGVFESPDGLGNWVDVNTGLPVDAQSIADIELAHSARGARQAQDSLWVGSAKGTYRGRAARRGTTLVWEDTGLGDIDVRALLYIPADDALYAGTEQGLWKLKPARFAGGTWSQVPGAPQELGADSVNALSLLTDSGPEALELLVGTEAGVFRVEINAATDVPVPGTELLAAMALLAGAMALSQRAARRRS